MNRIISTHWAQPRFNDLASQLADEGFRPGAPLTIRPATQAVDRLLCSRMKCGHCRKRGMGYHPYNLGSRYRVVAACPQCGHAEEI